MKIEGLSLATVLSLGVASADIPVKPAMPLIPAIPLAVTVSRQQQEYYKQFRLDASCSRWADAITKGQSLKFLFARFPQEKEFLIALEQMRVNQKAGYSPTINTIGCVPNKVYDYHRDTTNSNKNSEVRGWGDIFK